MMHPLLKITFTLFTIGTCLTNPAVAQAATCTCMHYNRCLKIAFPLVEQTQPKPVINYRQNTNRLLHDINSDVIMTNRQCSDPIDVCCKEPALNLTAKKRCGTRSLAPKAKPATGDIKFRIINSENNGTQPGEFPWMILVMKFEADAPSEAELCGGALVHPRVVLTSAHNIVGKKPYLLKVRAGEWDIKATSETHPHQDRQVKKVIVHENYGPDRSSLMNNFALLILDEPFELADHIGTVCLPKRDDKFDRSRCFATGWGKDKLGDAGIAQSILKKVELPVIPRDTCQMSLSMALDRPFILHKSYICAGGEPDSDTCTGDGGGPLVCPLTNDPLRYVQAGITAFGVGCGGRVPAVYSNVASARQWIDQNIIDNGIDIDEYQ